MGDSKANEVNFGFGFNDDDFSNRILHIEIIPEESLSPKMKRHKGMNEDPTEGQSLHINSLILAAKSPFFYKLFKNGMMESQQKNATLKINSSEYTPLMDLLNFMYTNTLSATSTSDLLEVLMIADKFEVSCCMGYCVELLKKMPMSSESASSYLELPSAILEAQVIQPLIYASKQYLVNHYNDFSKTEDEAMGLPLCAIELVLGSKGLQVDAEDDVYEFILKWSHAHYPNQEERQEVINNRLMRFICFRNMSSLKLKEAQGCLDFDREQVSNLVMEALFFKVGVLTTTEHDFQGRFYNDRFVKVMKLEFPSPSCTIYFDLKKKECGDMITTKEIFSESFVLDGRRVFLIAKCSREPQGWTQNFGIFLHMEQGSETCMFNLEIAVRKKSTKKFESCCEASNFSLTDQKGRGWQNLFDISWAAFMSDKSDYFIDGILHLRADLTIVYPQA